jgi:tetratricopeptide (TPR) repeat protein
MGSNEPNTHHDDDRQRLLDEIRRRAEEDELKRIEEEERSSGGGFGQSADGEASSPFPTLQGQFPSAGQQQTEGEQRAVILRERLGIALDRGNLENARDLLDELEALNPDDPALPGFHDRLAFAAIRELDADSLGTPEPETPEAIPEPLPPPPPLVVAPVAAPLPSAHLAERISDLLDSVRALYEQEKYEQALQTLNQVFLLDPEHNEALKMRQRIDDAWQLAEVIKQEAAKHREAEPLPAPAPQPAMPTGGKDADFWGPTNIHTDHPDAITGIPDVATTATPKVQKAPALDRIVANVSKVKIPVKPILTVAGVAVIAVAAWLIIRTLVQAVVPPDRVICVFPPPIIPGQTSDASLADGFVEDLIRDLGSVTSIRVVGPATTFTLRERTTKPATVARGLAAGFYVQSNLTVDGERCTGRFSLMDTVRLEPKWQTQFECAIEDLPAKRIELARALLAAMDVTVDDPDHFLAKQSSRRSSSGYRAYLLGRALVQTGDPAALGDARELFQQAVQQDSMLGDAWAGLGWVSIVELDRLPTSPSHETPRVLSYVQRAVANGAHRAETFRVWGMIELMNRQYEKAATRMQEAVDASPSDADALKMLARIQTLRGKTEDALHTALRAVAIDPLNPSSHMTTGLVHQFRGEFKEAEESYRRAIQENRADLDASELHACVMVYLQRADEALNVVADITSRDRTDPLAHYQFGRMAQTAGRPKLEWTASLERARTLLEEQLRARPDDASALSLLALTQTRLGSFRDAGVAMDKALALAQGDSRVLYGAARMYALQRDKAKAMTSLTQALDIRYDLQAIVDMDLFNLRTDEDFLRSVTR